MSTKHYSGQQPGDRQRGSHSLHLAPEATLSSFSVALSPSLMLLRRLTCPRMVSQWPDVDQSMAVAICTLSLHLPLVVQVTHADGYCFLRVFTCCEGHGCCWVCDLQQQRLHLCHLILYMFLRTMACKWLSIVWILTLAAIRVLMAMASC